MGITNTPLYKLRRLIKAKVKPKHVRIYSLKSHREIFESLVEKGLPFLSTTHFLIVSLGISEEEASKIVAKHGQSIQNVVVDVLREKGLLIMPDYYAYRERKAMGYVPEDQIVKLSGYGYIQDNKTKEIYPEHFGCGITGMREGLLNVYKAGEIYGISGHTRTLLYK